VNFEKKVRESLPGLFKDQETRVVVDNVDVIDDRDGGVLSVSFHLEGAWGSKARFTFPFAEAVPLDQSLAALHDLVARNWRSADKPPHASEVRAVGFGAGD
jgi:hypothetical protein